MRVPEPRMTGHRGQHRPQKLWKDLGPPDLRTGGERERAAQVGLRTGLRALRLLGWQSDHTPSPMGCPLLTPREIEFLKKETAQRRVLEESELARKEEMDKLLDKVGPGVRWGRGQQGDPSSQAPCRSWRETERVVLLARGPATTRVGRGAGPVSGIRPDPSPFCLPDLRTGREPAITEEFQLYLTGITP